MKESSKEDVHAQNYIMEMICINRKKWTKRKIKKALTAERRKARKINKKLNRKADVYASKCPLCGSRLKIAAIVAAKRMISICPECGRFMSDTELPCELMIE